LRNENKSKQLDLRELSDVERIALSGDNPSLRFYCLYKETLDKILKDIEKARESNNKSKVLGLTLEMYLAYREKTGCEGFTKGADKCVHWSPERVEVNRS
jgi:hypothetical protein